MAALLIFVGSVGVLAIVAPKVAIAQSSSTWTDQSPGVPGNLDAISCPSTSTCFAVGNGYNGIGILATTNGGGTWTDQFPGVGVGLYAISCPSTSTCFAVGYSGAWVVILATTNGGGTWTDQSPGVPGYLNAISCPSTSTCFAVGNGHFSPNYAVTLATTNGGGTWTDQSPGLSDALLAISCPSTSICFAVGDSGTSTLNTAIRATTNGGSTWTDQSPGVSGVLNAISCPSTSTCFAGGYSYTSTLNAVILATTNGGGTWTDRSPGVSSYFNAISCPSTSTCFAGGNGGILILATTNGGSTWTDQSPGVSGYLEAISCPSTSTCFAVGYSGTSSYNALILAYGASGGSLHPTATAITCTPTTVSPSGLSNCSVTVSDTASAGPTTPKGSVTFSSTGPGSFSTTSCALVPSGVSSTCQVAYTAGITTSKDSITAAYTGDSTHSGSTGSFQLNVAVGCDNGSSAPPSPSDADLLGFEICQFAQGETAITNQVVNILDALSTLPQVQLGTANVYYQPASGTFSLTQVVAIETASQLLQIAINKQINELATPVAKYLAGKLLGGEIPCAVSAAKDLGDAANSDVQAASDFSKASASLAGVNGGLIGGTTATNLVDSADQGAAAMLDKLNSLNSYLSKAAAGCLLTQGQYDALARQMQAASVLITLDIQSVQVAFNGMAFIAKAGWLLLGQVGNATSLPVVINLPSFPLTLAGYPSGVSPGSTITPLTSPSLSIVGTTNVCAGCSIGVAGVGYGSFSTVSVSVASVPVKLAALTTDSTGSFSTRVQIPAQTTGGQHELYAVGVAPDGSQRVLTALINVTAAKGQVANRQCVGTLSGTFNGGLKVLPGMVCTITNARVNGGVTVGAGAVFEADSSVINGGVVAFAPTAFVLCGDRVNGGVTVQSSALPALIGSADSPLCAPTTITGRLLIS